MSQNLRRFRKIQENIRETTLQGEGVRQIQV